MLLYFHKVQTGLFSPVLHSFILPTVEISLSLLMSKVYSFPSLNVRNAKCLFIKLPYSGPPYHNTSNYFLAFQNLKSASSTFAMAINAIPGTYTAQIHLQPLYVVCFVLVTGHTLT